MISWKIRKLDELNSNRFSAEKGNLGQNEGILEKTHGIIQKKVIDLTYSKVGYFKKINKHVLANLCSFADTLAVFPPL